MSNICDQMVVLYQWKWSALHDWKGWNKNKTSFLQRQHKTNKSQTLNTFFRLDGTVQKF